MGRVLSIPVHEDLTICMTKDFGCSLCCLLSNFEDLSNFDLSSKDDLVSNFDLLLKDDLLSDFDLSSKDGLLSNFDLSLKDGHLSNFEQKIRNFWRQQSFCVPPTDRD